MKSKILFICCFILLLCGCSKKEDTKTEELLTNNDIGFTIIVEDGRGITKDSKINHINDYSPSQTFHWLPRYLSYSSRKPARH